jgi:cation:H+ antiporter
MALVFVAVGIALLFLGSEGLLRGGIGISKAVGLSPVLCGLFVVTLATNAPELSVALQTVSHTPDVAVATVIGSNIINLLLIMGLGALFTQLPTPPKTVFRDGIVLILACAALAFVAFDGRLTPIEGFILLGGFVVYAAVSIITDWNRPAQDSEARAQCRGASDRASVNLFVVFLGLVAVVLGGRCLIDGALTFAAHHHITNTMTGLTIMAGAVALPEFVLMIMMARRDWSFVTAGHLLTASIFNILVVIGLIAATHPFAISPAAQSPDVYILLAAAIVLFPLMILSWRLTRPNGLLLIVLYIAYGAFLAHRLGYLPAHLPHFG